MRNKHDNTWSIYKVLLVGFVITSMYFTTPALAGIDLDGDGDHITVGNQSELTIGTGDFTVYAVFNPDIWTAVHTIVGKDNNVAGGGCAFSRSGWILFLQNFPDKVAIKTCASGTNEQIVTSADLTTGSWYIAVARRDAGTDLDLWVDGTNTNLGSENSSDISSTDALAIGREPSVASGNFNGKISEVAFWNVALTDHEVDLLNNSKIKRIALQIQPANLQLYLPLDDFAEGTNLDTSADTYMDLSKNRYDGTGVDGDTDSLNFAEQLLSYQ